MKKIIVIGGGLMGCAAAWQLARGGCKVTLIEKQSEEYKQGSSFGETRVTRNLGVDQDVFSYLQEISVHETKALIDLLNKWDTEVHALSDIHQESPVTYIYDKSQQQEVDLLVRDEDYQIARDDNELKEMFGIDMPGKICIREFKAHSGTMNPKELIRKLKLGIKFCGGQIIHDSSVTKITRNNDGFEVETQLALSTEHDIMFAEKIIVAVGPYTSILLKEMAPVLQELLQPQRRYLTFFQLGKQYWDSLSLGNQKRLISFFPVAEFDNDIYYSMIDTVVNGAPLIKVGGHNRNFSIKNQNNIWQDDVPDSEINWSLTKTISYLNSIGFNITEQDLKLTQTYACIYTMTASEIPLVSPLIKDNNKIDHNIIIIAGLSGVGAKGTLAYGRHAADYILGNDVKDPMYQKAKLDMGIDRLKI